MPSISKELKQLSEELESSLVKIDFSSKSEKYRQMLIESQELDFWSDSEKAQKHMQALGKLESEIKPWQDLAKSLNELIDLDNVSDSEMKNDIFNIYEEISSEFKELKKQLKFSGEYDDKDVVMSIHAGAGGTDAMDWAAMLLRMYLRWAEQNNLKTQVLEESPGEEAGIKSISLEVSGSFAYGKLKAEHGVHRLVRLSPFNSDAKRQTSFAKVEILPKIDEPDQAPIDESDLKIDVFRAGGHGGQSVNTTDSAVRITHLPTGIVVSIQNERSQIQNKETAMTILRSKLVQLKQEQHKDSLAEIKGPNQSAEWGNQIRSYVLHPYTMVKDLRTGEETTQAQAVLDGNINNFINAYLEK